MAFYDSGATYGSMYYDEAAPATHRKRMIQVKLGLDDMNDLQLEAYSANHIVKITGNAAFTTPVPGAVPFQSLHDAFTAALADSTAKDQASQQATLVNED